MRLAFSSPASRRIFRCSLAVGWLTPSFSAINTPQTPSSTRSPSTCGRKCLRGCFNQSRICSRRSPVVEASGADFGLPPVQLVFKLEFLQHSGSFKTRGAFSNLLSRAVPPAGVVAASGGNHGVAVAFAAMKLRKPATIFVPTVCSPEKMERIRGYDADLVVTGERYADALAASDAWAAEWGALGIHAYDQVETLLGQGTVGLEFEEQAPSLDALLVAVGGGGLIGGVAAWYSGRTRMIGLEPAAAPAPSYALTA